MQNVCGKPFFVENVEKLKQYGYLNKNIQHDILIVGGGVNGCLLNYYLSQNYDVVLVEKSRIGHGCTCAATALLEWQLDDFQKDLSKYLSEQEVAEVYEMGIDCLGELDKLINKLENNCQYQRKSAFLFSQNPLDVKSITDEHMFRIKNGFESILIKSENNPYNFNISAGIYSKNGGAQLNPYLFCKQLIESSPNQNSIYENTDIIHVENASNNIVATTAYGEKIYCKKIIYATGFNHTLYSQKSLCDLFVSSSIVANVPKDFTWYEQSLMQDNLSPYHYFRFVYPGKIIMGGEDFAYKTEIKPKKVEKMYKKLENYLISLFPDLKNKYEITNKFCGLFGSTKNNLGIIGKMEKENHYVFSSCGANGIINAFYGCKIISNLIENKKNKLEYLFSPLREK